MNDYKAFADRLRGTTGSADEQITLRITSRSRERLDFIAAEVGQKRGFVLRELVEKAVTDLFEAIMDTHENCRYVGEDAASTKGTVDPRNADGEAIAHGDVVTIQDRWSMFREGTLTPENYPEVIG